MGFESNENPASDINDFYEVHTVLANRIEEWERQITDKAMHVGEYKVIHRLLTKKFGELPNWAVEKLQSASSQELQKYEDRFLDAETLEQVFS